MDTNFLKQTACFMAFADHGYYHEQTSDEKWASWFDAITTGVDMHLYLYTEYELRPKYKGRDVAEVLQYLYKFLYDFARWFDKCDMN